MAKLKVVYKPKGAALEYVRISAWGTSKKLGDFCFSINAGLIWDGNVSI